MKVKIMCNHPVATRAGPQEWDGKVYSYSGDLLDLASLGAWLSAKVGFSFAFSRGMSRVENGRCIFFPLKYRVGVHCMWVEEVS